MCKNDNHMNHNFQSQYFLIRFCRYDGFLHARGLATGVFPKDSKKQNDRSDNVHNENCSDSNSTVDMDDTDGTDTDSEVTRPRKPPR